MIVVHIDRPLWELGATTAGEWYGWLGHVEIPADSIVVPSTMEVAGCTVTYDHMERSHEGVQLGPVRRTRVCAGTVDRPPAGYRITEEN